ncbi:hypothetical protein Dsin_024248 [Dipteronia sinensis]|uniref:Uncharacterized protein n=1 Tax=Dipteronia sinensis TaxID=43782 RepID=A0AAD9ZUZ4_9ROSI|nr:hypothetical protein Dsin_024248 [Dipteronia sinensis]
MQRWTINAKDVSEVDSSSSAAPTNIIQIARYGALSSKCSKMCYYASMSTEGYKEANMAIDKLTIQMNGLLPSSSRSREEHVHRRKAIAISGRPCSDRLEIAIASGQMFSKAERIATSGRTG